VVAWAALYRALGYGASGSDTYLDPGAEPGAFLSVAPLRLLVLLNALTLKASSDWWIILPAARPAMYVGGVLGVAFVAWLARRSWAALSAAERTAVQWLALGSVLALVPVLRPTGCWARRALARWACSACCSAWCGNSRSARSSGSCC
jgi:hypothetical protein